VSASISRFKLNGAVIKSNEVAAREYNMKGQRYGQTKTAFNAIPNKKHVYVLLLI